MRSRQYYCRQLTRTTSPFTSHPRSVRAFLSLHRHSTMRRRQLSTNTFEEAHNWQVIMRVLLCFHWCLYGTTYVGVGCVCWRSDRLWRCARPMCRGYNRHDPTDEKERKKHPYSIIANKNGRNYYAMYATFLEIEFLFSQFTKRPTFTWDERGGRGKREKDEEKLKINF